MIRRLLARLGRWLCSKTILPEQDAWNCYAAAFTSAATAQNELAQRMRYLHRDLAPADNRAARYRLAWMSAARRRNGLRQLVDALEAEVREERLGHLRDWQAPAGGGPR